MNKKTVGVFFGSRSAEHDVSIVTALSAVIKPLVRTGLYTVVPIYIAKNGAWFTDPKLTDIALYSSGGIDAFTENTKPVGVILDGGLTLLKPGLRGQRIPIDIAFPATHGTYGEDGSLQGIFRMANIPFVGCDLAASAIAMDKVLTKQIAEHEGIPVPAWMWCTRHEFEADKAKVLARIERLKYPLFVKPAHLGSSIGITKVTRPDNLGNALEIAAHYDDKILVEEGIPNLIEVTVPVMGNDTPHVGMVERPLALTEEGVFDFETKYMGQGKGTKNGKGSGKQGAQGYSEIPAKISEKLYAQAEKAAADAYRTIGCSGIARVDLLIDSVMEKVYFNEVNPLPGSLYLHNWRAAGMSPVEVVTELVTLAEERHALQQKIATTFSTNFLQQF